MIFLNISLLAGNVTTIIIQRELCNTSIKIQPMLPWKCSTISSTITCLFHLFDLHQLLSHHLVWQTCNFIWIKPNKMQFIFTKLHKIVSLVTVYQDDIWAWILELEMQSRYNIYLQLPMQCDEYWAFYSIVYLQGMTHI